MSRLVISAFLLPCILLGITASAADPRPIDLISERTFHCEWAFSKGNRFDLRFHCYDVFCLVYQIVNNFTTTTRFDPLEIEAKASSLEVRGKWHSAQARPQTTQLTVPLSAEGPRGLTAHYLFAGFIPIKKFECTTD